MNKYNWKIVDSLSVMGGRLALVTRETQSGRFIQAAIAWEGKIHQDFPKCICGGGSGDWRSCRQVMAVVKKALADIDAGNFRNHGYTADQTRKAIHDAFDMLPKTDFDNVLRWIKRTTYDS